MDYSGTSTKFDFYDFTVLFSSLCISAGIGLYYRFSGGKQKTTQEFLLGDRSQKIIPVAVSLIASMMSSITLLGVSAEVYMHSTQFMVINLGYILVTPIIAYFYLPVYFNLQATSVFEYLERRFGSRLRFTTSSVYFLQTMLYMGVVLYAPALTLEALTGISQSSSILITGVVCTFYSTLGGMKAVIATDIFQMVLMFLAIFIIIFTAVFEKNGFGPVWNIAKDHGRIKIFDFDPDPTVRHSFWSLVIGGGWTYLALSTVNQTQMQRFMTLKDLKSAILTLYMSLPIVICLSLSTAFSGLAIFSKYYDCDPIKSKRISRGDQLMPLYVLDVVGNIPGLTGFFVSGIFSAGLSTISAILNSLSAITLEDYIKPVYLLLYKKSYPVDQTIQVTKVLVCIFGGLCIALAFLSKMLGGVLQASLTILGVVGGPLLGVFTLGMFIPFANELGGLSGMIISLLITLCISFGHPKPPVTPLPLSTIGCFHSNDTTDYIKNHTTASISKSLFYNTDIRHQSNLTVSKLLPMSSTLGNENYPYLYRISYLWYVVIGFLLTMIIGILISLLSHKFYGKRCSRMDPNLFTPPVANYLRKRQLIKENKHMSHHSNGKNLDRREAVALL
ncbi:putative sodium-dependent multivitamin transporter [Lycorma delicatula]|uniref:putative sodium-dependent multivitamin transporter n=1 Tax=Lycorma delicatula TaxID=130591 RepID=UPI003F517023